MKVMVAGVASPGGVVEHCTIVSHIGLVSRARGRVSMGRGGGGGGSMSRSQDRGHMSPLRSTVITKKRDFFLEKIRQKLAFRGPKRVFFGTQDRLNTPLPFFFKGGAVTKKKHAGG